MSMRIPILLAAAALAAGCATTQTAQEGEKSEEQVAESKQETRSSRRCRGGGYAHTGTRIKRCSRVGDDVTTTTAEGLDNVGRGSESQMTGRGTGGPPSD